MTTTNHTGDLTKPTAARTQRAKRPGQIKVRLTGGDPAEFKLVNGSTITFGRSRASQVVIDDPSVSKVHFALRALDGGIELEDLGSKNGTHFRGRRVRRMTLMPGDRFLAGACEVELLDVGQVDVDVSPDNQCGLLIGESVAMRELFATIEKYAPVDVDLLIHGETGTGKEVTAQTIHELSRRKDKAFVTLDCSALVTNLAETAIFGFQRGAFTGAVDDRPGLFEQADGGTIFIDEIGELSLDQQVRFLRVLDRRQVTRLGEAGKVREFNVRVVAATNRDLNAEIRAGRFREDLFHRVAQKQLRVPPLRDRGMDVLLLAQRFLGELTKDRDPISIADDARTALVTYDWPGNVRELKNVILRTAPVCKDGVIRLEDLDLGRPHGWESRLANALDDSKSHNYESLHLLVDRMYLPAVLEEHRSLSATARHLGISRVRLRARLKALGLYDRYDNDINDS